MKSMGLLKRAQTVGMLRMVMVIVLMTISAVTAWGDGGVTIMRYLQSKQDFADSCSAGAIIVHGGSSLCYWDDSKNALRVTGGTQSGSEVNVSSANGIALPITGVHGPFKKVDTNTGFTLSMEAWIVNNKSASTMARFFDATKYFSGHQGDVGNRQFLFGFKPLAEITFYEWKINQEVKYNGAIANPNYVNGAWANYLIMVGADGVVKYYIDGVLKNTASDTSIKNAAKAVLGDIAWCDLTIGNAPSWEKNKQLDGWIRNVQIVSSTSLTKVTLSGYNTTVTDWTKTLFANSVNISQQPLTVVGSSVTLTPHEGYYVDWSKITLSGASWTDSQNPGSFTMPNQDVPVTVASGGITMKTFGVAYDANGGTGSIANSTSVNYWTTTAATTANTITLAAGTNMSRVGYTFKEWNTKADGTGASFSSGKTGVKASDLGVTGNTQSNIVTLYAIWQKVDYTLSTSVTTQNYEGTGISGTGGTLTLKRAREASPDTYENASNAQINDRIQWVTAPGNDYFLYSISYTPSGESATTVWQKETNETATYFTMPAKATTVNAVFRKFQEFNFTKVGEGNGNSFTFEVNHRNGGFTASTTAMQTDQVRVKATVASGYVLRSVTYQYGSNAAITIYDGKGSGTVTTDEFSMPTSNVTVTAIFLANRTVSVEGHTDRSNVSLADSYNSNLNAGSSSGNASLTPVHKGDVITVTALPTAGWHFDNTRVATALFSLPDAVTDEAATTTAVSKEKAEIQFTMVDADIPVQALLTENSYTIVYDANNGSGAPANQTKKHFESLSLSTIVPTRDESTFLGWATTSNSTTADYAAGATVGLELNPEHNTTTSPDGSTVTLYAVWKTKEYKVSVDPGINGGRVNVDKTTATKTDNVGITYTAYDGYSATPTLYYYKKGEDKKAHQITGSTLTGLTADVTIYATFEGTYDVSKDNVKYTTAIANGVISVGGVSIEENNLPKIGSIVNAVAKPAAGYRLNEITWQRVASADNMKTRAAGETDVEVSGVLKYGDNSSGVTYNRETGEYVGVIEGLSGDIYMGGSFKAKDPLSSATVTMEGPGDQQWTGSAIVPDPSTYIVKFNGEVQTDFTIEWSNNVDENAKAKATITAGDNHELYTGSVTLDDRFTIVKAPDNAADYSTSYGTDFTYTGSAQVLSDLVVNKMVNGDKTTLTAGGGDGEYSVSYENNTNAGTATVKITINGTGGGTLIRTFDIKPKPITVTASAQSIVYGTPIASSGTQATLSGQVAGHTLGSASFAQTAKNVGTHSGDIEVSNAKIVNGTDDVTNNYSITYVKGDLTINQKTLKVKAVDMSVEYGDASISPGYTVEGLAYGENLTGGPTAYKLTGDVLYTQGKAAGTYTLTPSGATCTDNYTISYEAGTLTVTKYDLTKATVTVIGGEQGYDGTNAKYPESVVVKKGEWTVPEADYTVKYGGAASQKEPGSYTITCEAASDNVTGTATAETPLVIGKYALAGEKVTATIADQTFTGTQIRPTAFSALKMNDTDISTDDYDIISYGTNINVGTGAGTLTIRAKEESTKFKGDRTVTFDIVAADLSVSGAVTSVTYAGVVLSSDAADTHQLVLSSDQKTVSTSLNGQTIALASASLKVRLKNGAADLSPDDYDVFFQKTDETPVAAIPANAIGTYKVVVSGKGTGTNTINLYVTTDLTVKVTLPTTLPDAEWVTYYDERFNLQKPTGYQAYYVTSINADGTTVEVATVDFIPRNVPVLLNRISGTDSTFELEEYTGVAFAGSAYDGFVGVPSTGEMPEGKTPTYILMNSYFVGYEPGTPVDANRGFLTTVANAARLLIVDEATAVFDLKDKGEMIGDRWYDLMGNQINKPTRKGLYILNGKKVVVK